VIREGKRKENSEILGLIIHVCAGVVVSPWYEKYVRQVLGRGYVILCETFLSGNFDLFLARTDMILIKTDGSGKDIVVAGHMGSKLGL
jgi:hypothetical protein